MRLNTDGGIGKYIVTDRSFYRRAMMIVIPVLCQNLINQGVNMMDTVMVGQLAEASISASSLANQFYQIYNLLCMGISAAGLVLAAQYWGAGRPETVRRVFDLAMQTVIVIATGFAVLTALIPERIMRLYTDDEAAIREGVRYLTVTAYIFLPHGLSLVLSNIVRAVGNARLGLTISVISFLVNIGCNYVFIVGKRGLPAMGVQGAALGTLCARAVELTVCAVYMFRIEKVIRYRPGGILKPPSGELLREFRRLGLPAVISDTILGLAATAISAILGHMSTEIVSAYAIVVVVDRLCTVATGGIASAAGVVIGQTVGEGNIERARREGWSFLVMTAVIGVLAMALVRFVGVWSIGLYNITDETQAIAVSMMHASSIVVFFQAIQSALSKGILRGGGDTRFLMVADVIFQWCASIPLGMLLGFVLDAPPFWVLVALRIDYIIKAVWLTFRLRGAKWIHKAGPA